MAVTLGTILTKDPNATLDYELDLSAWIPSGDSVSTATWTCAPATIIAGSPAPSLSGSLTTIWLTGGTLGQTYELTCRFVTTQGRTDDRTVRVRIDTR